MRSSSSQLRRAIAGVLGALSVVAGLVAAFPAAASAAELAEASPSSARVTVYATYRATDNLSRRYTPTAAPGLSGGPRRGESLPVECQVEGEPAGPNGNRLYFWITYRGEHIYVPDAWTDSPHLAAQPPIAGIPICGAAPPPPSGSGTRTTVATPVRMCTNPADASCNPVWTLPAGTPLAMRCWIDDGYYAGTRRWFWISGGGYSGFVTANHVANQAAVGWCGSDLAIKAIRWAGSQMGEAAYRGWCQSFVKAAYSVAGRDIGWSGSAVGYWWSNPKRYAKTSSTAPPAGHLVYWNGTSGYPDGHVALSIGNGWAISTSERERSGGSTLIHVLNIADRNRTHPYLGAINVT